MSNKTGAIPEDGTSSCRDPRTGELPWIVRYVTWLNRALAGATDAPRPQPSPYPPVGSIAGRPAPTEEHRLTTAATRARSVYHGPVGALLERELRAAAATTRGSGRRDDRTALLKRVADQVLAIDQPPRSVGTCRT